MTKGQELFERVQQAKEALELSTRDAIALVAKDYNFDWLEVWKAYHIQLGA